MAKMFRPSTASSKRGLGLSSEENEERPPAANAGPLRRPMTPLSNTRSLLNRENDYLNDRPSTANVQIGRDAFMSTLAPDTDDFEDDHDELGMDFEKELEQQIVNDLQSANLEDGIEVDLAVVDNFDESDVARLVELGFSVVGGRKEKKCLSNSCGSQSNIVEGKIDSEELWKEVKCTVSALSQAYGKVGVTAALDPSKKLLEIVDHLSEDALTLRRKNAVLKQVFNLMDESNPLFLCRLCRIALSTVFPSASPHNWKYNSSSSISVNGCISPRFQLSTMDSTLNISQLPVALRKSCVTAARALYKLSKDEKNDTIFDAENVPRHLMSLLSHTCGALFAERSQCGDFKLDWLACDMALYSAGALKNVSNHAFTQQALGEMNVSLIFSSILNYREMELLISSEVENVQNRLAQLYIQITATLRNLIAGASSRCFVSRGTLMDSGIITRLASIIPHFISHSELMWNVTRIFAKLTLHSNIRQYLNALTLPSAPLPDSKTTSRPLSSEGTLKGFLHSFLVLMHKYPSDMGLVIRSAFVLGNITADSERSRQIIENHERGLEWIGELFLNYCALDLKMSMDIEQGKESCGSKNADDIQDTLTKIIRVLANLSISSTVGTAVSRMEGIDQLVRLVTRKLRSTQNIFEDSNFGIEKELILTAIGAISNISYHFGEENVIIQQGSKCVKTLLPLLLSSHNEYVLSEVGRALSNFSRSPHLRDLIFKMQGHRVLILLLSHSTAEVVISASGVLMNLASEPKFGSQLRESSLLEHLFEVIDNCDCLEDHEIVLPVLKTLYNFISASGTANDYGSVKSVLVELTEELNDYQIDMHPPLSMIESVLNRLYSRLGQLSSFEDGDLVPI
eukprot:GCRY01002504.1.p1 GENE.GCRY01002504.1~~GCRY01002504.1.p1  ORF type:complete len:856 (-),score=106.25 GCRY01002504.1:25-2592(-)